MRQPWVWCTASCAPNRFASPRSGHLERGRRVLERLRGTQNVHAGELDGPAQGVLRRCAAKGTLSVLCLHWLPLIWGGMSGTAASHVVPGNLSHRVFRQSTRPQITSSSTF